MKRLLCLMFSVLLLLLSACGPAAESTQPPTEETAPPLILSQQENFKCYVDLSEPFYFKATPALYEQVLAYLPNT